MVLYKVTNAMKQNKKQSKVMGFEILNGRGVDCCQGAILKGVVKVSLTRVSVSKYLRSCESWPIRCLRAVHSWERQHPEQRS